MEKKNKEKIKTKLDIGCGYKPQGDVNVDPFLEDTPHRNRNREMNPKEIPHFVRATVEYLPFRPVFKETRTDHLFEHLEEPLLGLMECARVAPKGHHTIPSNFSHDGCDSAHYYSWNLQTYTNFLKLCYHSVRVKYKGDRPYFGERKLAMLNPVMGWLGFHKELEARCNVT